MGQTVYFNGDIVTMEVPLYAEAVLARDGKIARVGSLAEVEAAAGGPAARVDLGGATMLPAFVDPHSHITSFANTLGLVPLQGADSMEEIIRRLKERMEERPLKPGEWLVGHGYDNNFLPGKLHPDRRVLDQVSNEAPIIIAHASGHMGVMNSAALRASGIGPDTGDPEGGRIGRLEDGREPSGYLEENAFMNSSRNIPAPTMEQMLDRLESAQDIYLSQGIATVQDGLTKAADWALLQAAAEAGRLKVDVVSYVDLKDHRSLARDNPRYLGKYRGGLKIGGYKIFLDGSPQGRTAWMSRPYENAGDGYCGYPIYSDEKVEEFCRDALREGVQLLAHCNGDAAAAQYLRCFAQALRRTEGANDIRPVMIHAQLLRPDQLPSLKPLHMIPSFFAAHVYHWGDVHIENFGVERARSISPARSAWKEGIPFTFHQDTPVIAPNMLETLWCAVNRLTRSGVLLGADERLPVLEALRAVTGNGAYQYFEEKDKGSIAEGKRADFVILSGNPLKVAPMELRELSVEATIRGGEVLYRRKGA